MKTEMYILVFFDLDVENIKEIANSVNGEVLIHNKIDDVLINSFLIKKLPILNNIKFHLFEINQFVDALNSEELYVENCFISSISIIFK